MHFLFSVIFPAIISCSMLYVSVIFFKSKEVKARRDGFAFLLLAVGNGMNFIASTQDWLAVQFAGAVIALAGAVLIWRNKKRPV